MMQPSIDRSLLRVTTTVVRPGNALPMESKVLRPHDHVMPHGQRLEMLEVFRAAPRQSVVDADGAVLRHRDDE